jgi:very-short-patch-repair endonuclease
MADSTHLSTESDDRRTSWLNSQGFEVLRFWNNDVIDNIEGVLEAIIEALDRHAHMQLTPHPGPLPQGERED